jgi:L-alanine-DL-glutamate epimerase-like enolase superfamily enzyme
LGTAIAGYETEVGLYGFRELITQRAVDIIQPDIAWAGGFTECRRIAALAHAYNMMVAPHAFSSAITLVAAMHLLASIPNGLILEFDQNPCLRQELLKAHQHGWPWVGQAARSTGAGSRVDPASVRSIACDEYGSARLSAETECSLP